MIREAILIFLLACTQAEIAEEKSGKSRSTYDRIRADGYPAEYFDLVTSDGYILQIYRIPRGRNDFAIKRRPAILLQHGLQNTPNAFLGIDVNSSLAYNLADLGFDVWLGTTRGVEKSRRHILLNPDSNHTKKQFWDFTFEEIALIDQPRIIDFVLAHSKQQRLHYVGHSQGATTFFVLNSRKPEYNDKFKTAHLMAPVGYQKHFPNKLLTQVADQVDVILALTNAMGFFEIKASGETPKSKLAQFRSLARTEDEKRMIEKLTAMTLNAIEEIARAKSSIGGAGVKQYAHYGQNIRDHAFRSWDYGLIGNLQKYGTTTPPEYNITKVTVTTTLHYSFGDILLDPLDVMEMSRNIPNCKVRKVPKDDFSHIDFVLSKRAKAEVYDYVIGELKRWEF